MAVAATKRTELLDLFIAILSEKRKFQGYEEFQYLRELSDFPEGEIDGDELRAFYYACSGNVLKSISYFKKSLAYNEPDFMENYLIYLMVAGHVKQYISETIKVNQQLTNNPKLLIQLARACLLNGDLEGMVNVREELAKLGDRFISFIDYEIESLNIFKKNLDLSSEQLKFLIDNFVNIADKNKLDAINIHFDFFEENGDIFNSIIFYSMCNDTSLLSDMDFELAKIIAQNSSFIGKRFSPSFEYFEYRKDEKDTDYVHRVW